MNTFNRIKSDLAGIVVSGKVRVAFLVFTIVLFILAAGAPGASGGIGD